MKEDKEAATNVTVETETGKAEANRAVEETVEDDMRLEEAEIRGMIKAHTQRQTTSGISTNGVEPVALKKA